jgi:hypothetical protein
LSAAEQSAVPTAARTSALASLESASIHFLVVEFKIDLLALHHRFAGAIGMRRSMRRPRHNACGRDD